MTTTDQVLEAERPVCPYCGEADIDTAMTVVEGVCWRDLCLNQYWDEWNAETLR